MNHLCHMVMGERGNKTQYQEGQLGLSTHRTINMF